jgi:hypothetical protein
MTRRKPKRLTEPYPHTATIPDTGLTFFDKAEPGESYRLARLGIIPTIEMGLRTKLALPRVLARRLERDTGDTD